MNKLQELISKLEELFELDKADLDFGIHRIIRQKHKQIQEYLHQRLPETVRETLGELLQNELRKNLKELHRKCRDAFGEEVFGRYGDLAEEFRKTPIGKPYTEILELVRQSPDGEQLENEVYSHLYEFFSRYYEDADFISLPRHGNRYKYAIPYNGEEVVLHWANKDQYYIKSSEDMKDYVFTLEDSGKTCQVKFRLSRMDPVLNNNKAIRAFVPDEEAEIQADETSLVIPFHFKRHDRKPAEKQIIESLCEGLTPRLPELWRKRLCAADETCTGKETRTVLEKHLRNYTKKNTSDYFIHKNLGGFLRHELDFYIKNEVMHLDDVDNRTPKYLEGEIRKIKAIRGVAKNLIDFLAQIEDFQKKLWLKKKFVYESQWCMTLDRVPESFYPEIAANHAQREEWEKLYCIQDMEAQIGNPGHKKGSFLTVEFLKANPFLMVDTAFFSTDFKYRLLAEMGNIDEQTDGLLLHSENFQALQLLQARYKEQVQCIYIDPPYNTGNDGFIYKDSYKHSSWFSLLESRIIYGIQLLSPNGVNFFSIDDWEAAHLKIFLNGIFGEENFLEQIIWKKRSTPPNDKIIGAQHEYILLFSKNLSMASLNLRERSAEQTERYKNPDNHPKGPWASGDLMANIKGGRYVSSLYFPIKNPVTGEEHYPSSDGNWRFNKEKIEQLIANNEIWFGENGNVRPKLKRFLCDVKKGVTYTTLWDFVPLNTQGSKEMTDILGFMTAFESPKPVGLIEEINRLGTNSESLILDYFAGSGTTGHAVINLNREDGGNRKYILVEMADYFDTVLKPRIQKVVYSKEWKDGKPVSHNTGISHCFKYMRLESYEDTLNNLQTEDRHPDTLGISVPQKIKDEYLIRYMLDMETRSQLCSLAHFEDPFHVTLNIYNRESGRSEPHIIDLPETFNYLLGLRVHKTRMQNGFLVIEGENPEKEPVLIIWRNTKEKDHAALDDFVKNTLQISMADTHYTAVYINGDTTIDDPRSKIQLTEEIFYTLMFDTESAETGDLSWQ